MRDALCLFIGFLLVAPSLPGDATSQGFSWDLLWSGSWEAEGNLINRGDLRFHIPWQDLSLRAQIIDKRPVPPWEQIDMGNTRVSGGLYHEPTGSRLLYGILDERGLPARIRNPWIRAVPFVEYHQPSVSDLKTEPSSTKEPEAYLYLGSPSWGIFKGFASALLDETLHPAFGGGLEAQFNKKSSVRLEGFYTGKELSPRHASTWFSTSPPLPEREFHLYALGLVFTSPYIGIASDWAYSDTFAYGRDLYGNLGLRIGSKPWRLSLAADGAGSRYVGRDGTAIGPGFRTALGIERRGKQSSLFRLHTSLRAGGLGEPFERSSSLIYYRFPAGSGGVPIRPSRISLALARNASDLDTIQDRFEGSIGLRLGPLRSVFSGTLIGISSATEPPPPFPIPEAAWNFSSAKISGELSYNVRIFQFKATVGYTVKKEKDPLWDSAWYASVRGKRSRFSLKIASPDFPAQWTYTLSWRLEW
ncbi:MAG: hypothetical protein LBT14_04565 [Treponema sp.]|jgi:hypothetical protein|nr:hypothetical protein [Treponema sp.]